MFKCWGNGDLTLGRCALGFEVTIGTDRAVGLGKSFAGAVIITLGMFFLCFVFNIAFAGKLVRNRFLSDFFDGLCAAVIGVIAIIAAQILKSSVEGSPRKGEEGSVSISLERVSQSAPAAVPYILALAVLYKFADKYTALLLLASGAIAGQFLFV